MKQYRILNQNVAKEIKKVVMGKDVVISKVLAAILAKGHILIEDIPGVGKTTLALAFSKAMSLEYKRIQFTPDVLPSDVIGFSVLNRGSNTFEYKEGSIFCNLFLADEINRTSTKTQSALLEVMEEGKVTVDGQTRKLPAVFNVIATQNPIGSAGTHMLPESQLDRFMIRLSMGYPNKQSEINMLKAKSDAQELESICPILNESSILAMQKIIEDIYVDDKMYEYIVELIDATRNNPYIDTGVSPRGTIALTNMAKSIAFLKGRDYVIPDDVLFIFNDVVAHRIVLNSKALVDGKSIDKVLKSVTMSVDVPSL